MEITQGKNYQVAGYLKRFASVSIDTLMVFFVFHIITLAVYYIMDWSPSVNFALQGSVEVLIFFGVIYGVFIFPRKMKWKQTMGEHVLKLKLISSDGSEDVSAIGMLLRVVGYAMVFFTGWLIYFLIALVNFRDPTNLPEYVSSTRVLDLKKPIILVD